MILYENSLMLTRTSVAELTKNLFSPLKVWNIYD